MRFFSRMSDSGSCHTPGRSSANCRRSFAVDPLVLLPLAGLEGHLLPFDFGHHLKGPVPAALELAGYKTVLRLCGVILPSRAPRLEAGLLETICIGLLAFGLEP